MCAPMSQARGGHYYDQSNSYNQYGQDSQYGQFGQSTQDVSDYMSDISSDGFYTWPKDKLPVKVYFKPGDGVPGFKSYYPDILREAFNEWSQASNGRVAWKEVTDPNQANIRVAWSDQVVEEAAGTEAGKTRTYARYNPRTNWGVIDKADMRLLTRLPEREFTDAEVTKAYLHEVGHAFGIAGHSNDRHDIMYHAVVNTQHPQLGQRDIATLDHIYDQAPQQQQLIGRQPVSTSASGVQAADSGRSNSAWRKI